MNPAQTLALLATGIDIAIAVLVIEFALLAVFKARTGIGLPILTTAIIAGSGMLLILALRVAVGGGSAALIAILLSGAGLLHAVDLWRRLKRMDRE